MRPYDYDHDPGDPKGAGVPGNGRTVLLVDDDMSVSGLAEATLTAQGYKVLSAQNSDQALRMSDEHPGPIHLLITDQVMPPFMSGQELATCLRLMRPDLKVLYISGYGAADVVADEVGDSFADFLAKPFSPENLVRKADALTADGDRDEVEAEAEDSDDDDPGALLS